jgi:hypothetical protein
MQVNLNGMKLRANFREYNTLAMDGENYRPAIELVYDDPETGWTEPWTTASVNLPNEFLKHNEVAIKSYSENEGVLEALQAAGIVGKPIYYANSGFVSIPICELLINPKG